MSTVRQPCGNTCAIGNQNAIPGLGSCNGLPMLRVFRDSPNQQLKLGDEFDGARDITDLCVAHDKASDKYTVSVGLRNVDPKAVQSDKVGYLVLLDFVPDKGQIPLPNGVRASTDHPWDYAYLLQSGKVTKYTAPQLPTSLNVVSKLHLNPQTNRLVFEIDKSQLRHLGWNEKIPLYVQVLSLGKMPCKQTECKQHPSHKIITDVTSDIKPWENSNFLVGAIPINLIFEYIENNPQQRFYEITPNASTEK